MTAEVQQHIGQQPGARGRHDAPTDGVVRGMEVGGHRVSRSRFRSGTPALGRILNVLGEPVDDGAPIPPDAERWPIHRETPKFVDLEPKTEMFETGIKVIDLIAPFVKGGKIGLFGGAGVGKTVVIMELINNVAKGARRQVGVLRRGRAHPRGQRPVPRDEGVAASSRAAPLIYGQMNEPPGARLRGRPVSALTVAEYFRDVEGQDVLLFIDNIFRFTQAAMCN